MTKTIHGETVRFTKSGSLNKQDVSKLICAYIGAIKSAVSGWEFLVMTDGRESAAALKAAARIDFLKSIKAQIQTENQ